MASGFCYVNDIVLAIQELLRCKQRVLYIDIDVHHGDGVEHAFYLTDRVLTMSFHEFDGEFFPATGSMYEVGQGKGQYFAVNVPFREGVDNTQYRSVFQPAVREAVDSFQPEAIVLQCGADSIAEDKLGHFNLSVEEHAACVKFVSQLGVPLLVLGGGGYTAKNVSRCWAYETACLLGVENELPSTIPLDNNYLSTFEPDLLVIPNLSTKSVNRNDEAYIRAIKQYTHENLRQLYRIKTS